MARSAIGLMIMIITLLFVPCAKSESRERVELGELIIWLMLDDNEKGPTWQMRSDTKEMPVLWSKAGVEASGHTAGQVRKGAARVSVNDKTFWVLRECKQEILWEISLAGTKSGVEKVIIEPCGDCFGARNSGCDFDWKEVFRSYKNIELKELCSSRGASVAQTLYEIKSKGKQDAYVLYYGTWGSGGESNHLQLWWKNPGNMADSHKACKRLNEGFSER